MLQKIRWFLLLAGIVLVLIFSLQNSEAVDFKFLIFQGRYPLTLLLLATSAVGFLLGALMTGWMLRRRRRPDDRRGVDKTTGPSEQATAAERGNTEKDGQPSPNPLGLHRES